MKLSLKDRLDDITGDKYLEIKIGNYEACCVKKPYDSNDSLYIMQCYDGKDVYSDISGADYPLITKETSKYHRSQLKLSNNEML